MREDIELRCLYTQRSLGLLLSCRDGHECRLRVDFGKCGGDGGLFFKLARRARNKAWPGVKETLRARAREDLHAAEEAALWEAFINRSGYLEGG